MTGSTPLSPRGIAVLIALAGAAYMAAIAANLLFASPHPPIGSHLYDLYAQSLAQGRFDLSAMDLRYEGHFAPDGTGYLYYGLGPLLTRLPFLPFVEMPTSWIAPFSIWLWAVVGTACFHRAFWLGLGTGLGGERYISGPMSALLAAAVWFAAPGPIVVSGGAVFHEPIAMAYALGGGFLLLIANVALGRLPLEKAIVPLAVLAGLAVHARPHLAIGYYLAVCLIAVLLSTRGGKARRMTAAGALAVLGLSGAILLASNALRFGNPATMHGSFGPSDLQYASAFWGLEDEDGRRAQAFERHGRFDPARIPGNALVYFLSPPSSLGLDPAIDAIERLHRRTIASTDLVSIHQPKAGALFLWPVWMMLMAIGFANPALYRMPALAGLAGTVGGALLLLSYPTITLRYHVDLWPVIALPAVFGISALGSKSKTLPAMRGALVVLLVAGLAVTLHKTMHNKLMNLDAGQQWTIDFCLGLTAKKGFDEARGREICGL